MNLPAMAIDNISKNWEEGGCLNSLCIAHEELEWVSGLDKEWEMKAQIEFLFLPSWITENMTFFKCRTLFLGFYGLCKTEGRFSTQASVLLLHVLQFNWEFCELTIMGYTFLVHVFLTDLLFFYKHYSTCVGVPGNLARVEWKL